MDGYINLYWMGSRWYDPALGRFLSPDPIVPSMGEGNNPNAVGYVAQANYSPLVVDYHETQFLEQLNQENQARLNDPNFRMPSVPANPLAFDRYSYSFNNPIRYVDPSGHNPIVLALVAIGPVGWVALGVLVVGTVVYFAAGGPKAFAEGLTPAVESLSYQTSQGLATSSNQVTQAANGNQTLFARPGNNQAQNKQFKGAVREVQRQLGRELTEDEVRQLHEAIHDLEDPGFWDIVEQGLKEFGEETSDEGDGE